jgi:uncharacterized membrane protein
MSDQHMTGRRMLEAGERVVGRMLAIVLGIAMMVSGLGMGVTIVLVPLGIPLGVIGLLLFLWGVFYSTPAGEAGVGAGPGQGHETNQAGR